MNYVSVLSFEMDIIQPQVSQHSMQAEPAVLRVLPSGRGKPGSRNLHGACAH